MVYYPCPVIRDKGFFIDAIHKRSTSPILHSIFSAAFAKNSFEIHQVLLHLF